MMLSVADIEQRLRDRVEALARELLPNAAKEGPYLRVGSISGEPGHSLVIYLQGAKQGRWHDFAGGDADHGDCLDLIEKSIGLRSKSEAVAWAKDWLGIVDQFTPRDRPRADPAELERREAAARALAEQRLSVEREETLKRIRGAQALYLRNDSRAIAGTPAEAYLGNRKIDVARLGHWPNSLKFNAECYNREAQLKIPAMLAMMVDAQGAHRATHRTFLQRCPKRGWWKIDSPNAKMVLGPSQGAFIPLRKGASGKSMRNMDPNEPVYVTEGIEDALTVAMALPRARVICGYSLNNIGSIILPEQARRLVIVCDRDENIREIDKLERSVARQQARGLHVQTVMPPPGVKDINDWLCSMNGEAA